jgi:hypothetical protein
VTFRAGTNYEDHIVDPCRKSLQNDLTGQVILKFQYPMTKTFAAVLPYRGTNLCPPAIIRYGAHTGR